MSRADEALKVGSALKTQLSRLSQLESENKKLTEDNSYLRRVESEILFAFLLVSVFSQSANKLRPKVTGRCFRLPQISAERQVAISNE